MSKGPSFHFHSYSIGLLLIGIAMLVANHLNAIYNHRIFPLAILLGPPAIAFGLGALFEPDLAFFFMFPGQQPTRVKQAFGIALLTTVILFVVLYL